MLIVISNPAAVANEAAIISTLFVDGLEIFHLRKPNDTADKIKMLIEKIKPEYYHRIALHQHHEMADNFGIKRLHFTESNRKKTTEEALQQLKANKYTLSTSIHQIEAYDHVPALFNYTFFGPVFDSISKQGYTSTLPADFIFPTQVNHAKVIAIGGIDATNIQQAIDMKFNGVAALGVIWQRPGENIQQFKTLQKAWEQTGQ